jgi:type VI secretion system protein ImpE
VRVHPEDAKLRTYLFQLLAVQGDWQRALNQLQVSAQLSVAALPMAQTYREAIRCEVFRAEVFAGKRTPQVLGEPPAWIGLLVEALEKLAQGHVAAAEASRAQAFEQAPARAGAIDGKPFSWIADADSRLGPVCEAIIDGKYYWVPFERLKGIRIDLPTDLRDVVWAPAQLQLETGAIQVALIPTRYPGSESADTDALRLSRMTKWREIGPETFVGIGQRMWATDAGEFALLDTREINLGSDV